MTSPLADFVHRTGAHCGSTSLRNVATRYGWDLDEATCFGLASGIGFTLFDMPGPPTRGFFVRPVWIEPSFFSHLGVEVDIQQGDTWRETERRLRRRTEAGDPVVVYTDIFHLEYFGTDTHFAPHTICVLDVGEDRVVLSDSEFDERQTVPVDQLREAMGSTAVFDLDYRTMVVTEPVRSVPFVEAARTAIARAAREMLDPEPTSPRLDGEVSGVAAIEQLAAELPTWTEFDDPHWSVRFAYQNVERRGTGGGTFRRLYAEFLETAATKLPELPVEVAGRTREIADDWTAVGETLRRASETETRADLQPYLTEASATLEAIARREARLFRELEAAVD